MRAAGLDRDGDLVGFGGAEDEFHVRGRLFHGLEQGVEGLAREHVDFVDDVDFVAGLVGGGQAGVGDELSGLVDGAVGGAVDLDDVQVVAAHDGPGHALLDALVGVGVGVVGGWAVGDGERGVEGAGEESGHGGLADAAGPGEEVGMGDAVGGDGVAERACDRFLADDLVEGVGAVPASEDGIGHGVGRRLMGLRPKGAPRRKAARTPTAPGGRHLGLLRSRPDPVRGPTRAPGPAAYPRGASAEL
jgi:hypothetical protein